MRNKKVFLIVLVAIMSAMAIALNKVGTIMVTRSIKLTLYVLPLLVVGIVEGPFAGLLAGIVTGTVEQLTSEWGLSAASFFYGLAPVAWGFVSGITYKLFAKTNKVWRYSLSIFISAIIANLLNTFAMYMDTLLIKDSYYTLTSILLEWPGRIITMLITLIPYILISYIVCQRLKTFKEQEQTN